MSRNAQTYESIWITWENQVRNHSMARHLQSKLYVIQTTGNRLKRYTYCILLSLLAIWSEKPKILYVQNPSLLLNFLALMLRPLVRFKMVSDAHYAGVVAPTGSRFLQRLLDFCNSRSDLVIVTNTNHARYIQSIGGIPFVCEDPLPDLPNDLPVLTENMNKSVFFICSFQVDEPYRSVFTAARLLEQDGFTLYVSGNYCKAGIDPSHYPHIRFLGYVTYELYASYLKHSSVIVDLTTCEDLLLCGAYEAMAALQPLVTSDTQALRHYFTRGAIFTDNAPENIAAAIRTAYQNRETLRAEILEWRQTANSDMANKILALRNVFPNATKTVGAAR
jgi:glycosyltransferase involved in cell wall biosynthesis